MVKPYLRFSLYTLCVVVCVRLSAQVKNWPEAEQHYYDKGREALQAKEYSIAARQFRNVLRIDPRNVSAVANLGVVAFEEKDYARASQEFTTALKLQPSLWNAGVLLGMTEYHLGNRTEAQSLLEDSFKHIRDPKLTFEAGMEMITLCYQAKDLEPCADVLPSLLQIRPVAPGTLYIAYRLYSDLAARSLSELVRTAPDSAEVHEVLAQALATRGDFPAAIAQYRKALQISPKLSRVHYELGLMILSNSHAPAALGDAEQQFDLCLRGDPTNGDSEYMLGEIRWFESKPKEALQYYRRALQLQPDSVDAHLATGRALTTLGQASQALTQLLDAVRLGPRNEVAHYRLAEAYRKLGRSGDADREEEIFRRLRSSHDPVRALYKQVLEEQSVVHRTIGAPAQ